jgi:hypothetical protein
MNEFSKPNSAFVNAAVACYLGFALIAGAQACGLVSFTHSRGQGGEVPPAYSFARSKIGAVVIAPHGEHRSSSAEAVAG